MRVRESEKIRIGWREWCQLPELGIPWIKAKVDTGAKTSAIHAFDIYPYKKKRIDYVSFKVAPIQGNSQIVIKCHAEVVDRRHIMSSNGIKELRFVIASELGMGETDRCWKIHLSLSNRDPLKFRMLLGRDALANRVVIDPIKSFLCGKISGKEILSFYD